MNRTSRPAPELADAIVAGDRQALAAAITVIESGRPTDRDVADELIARIWPSSGGACRIGITGAAGVGKSSLIEALGLHMIAGGRRVAVLAIDPSSATGGGALLGDRTRMPGLAATREAFVRATPAGSALGGVGGRTREAIRLCEAAGHDIVIVETMGTGQSEAEVAGMTDVFVLMVAPGGGDELQGVKRGVMELADLVLVNKCDGEFAEIARRTQAEYATAMRLFRQRPADPEGFPAVLGVSAREGTEIESLSKRIRELDAWRAANGHRPAKRRQQDREWMRALARETLLRRAGMPDLNEIPSTLDARLETGEIDPATGAREWLRGLTAGTNDSRTDAETGETMDRDQHANESLEEMVALLVARGIRHPAVLKAMREVPRASFVPQDMRPHAHADRALSIGNGQTISQPYVVARMTEALLGERERLPTVLEIGTGSGYQTAVLARIAEHVYTVERIELLLALARHRLLGLGVDNVRSRLADGHEGWESAAPFDGIMVTAAAAALPETLTDQLAEGGILVAPLDEGASGQELVELRKSGGKLARRRLAGVQFVPLVAGICRH